jgi:hypothetical protein
MSKLDPDLDDLEAPPDTVDQAEPVDVDEEPDDLRIPIEANEADAVEQAAAAGPPLVRSRVRVPFEADEGDAAEQAQVVFEPDDDYR